MHPYRAPQSSTGGGWSFGRGIDAGAAPLEATTAVRGHRMRERPRILVVEDDFLVATLLAEILESAGWQVVGPVAHLAGALDAAVSEDFDAAVLDVNLGDQTVYPVAEVLDARGVPFVFVTAYGREALPRLFCGRPHLGKPFAPRKLIGTVSHLIAPAADAPLI